MTPLTRRCEPDSVEPGPFLPYRATTKHAAISVSSARQHLESPRRIDRPELLGNLVGIQLVYRIRFWLGFRDRRPCPLKAQRPAIGKAVVGKAQLDSEVHCA